MVFAALIQLITNPTDHDVVVELLLNMADNSQAYDGNLSFNIHYLPTNVGAFYVLNTWQTQLDMDNYLADLIDGQTSEQLLSYLVAEPTISRSQMLSRPVTAVVNDDNQHQHQHHYQQQLTHNRRDNDQQVTLIPFFYIIPTAEDIEQVKRAHLSVINSTRNEPGCLTYDLYQLLDEPAIMFFYENWSSAAVLNVHMNTSNFYRVVRQQVDPYLLVPWTALSMTIVKN